MSTKTEQGDGLYTPGIVTAGVVAAVGTFVVIVALQALYLSLQQQQTRTQAQNAINSSESLLAEQRIKLNQFGWIDRQRDIVSIPIDLAIELTAEELRLQRQATLDEQEESGP